MRGLKDSAFGDSSDGLAGSAIEIIIADLRKCIFVAKAYGHPVKQHVDNLERRRQQLTVKYVMAWSCLKGPRHWTSQTQVNVAKAILITNQCIETFHCLFIAEFLANYSPNVVYKAHKLIRLRVVRGAGTMTAVYP